MPEIEHLRRTLAKRIVGSTIDCVDVRRADVIRTPRGRGGRQATAAMCGLRGARVTTTDRHGKQLAILTTRGVLVVHLGMSGRLQAVGEQEPTSAALVGASHVHMVMTLIDAEGRRSIMVHRDPRRFGGLWLRDTLEDVRRAEWSRLGPDALTIRRECFLARLSRGRSIKAMLLDQSIVAGVGNIYADEALHRARLHPATRGVSVSRDRLGLLHTALGAVLRAAVRAGGSTIRDFQDAAGRFGTYAGRHRVYARAGLPCLDCGTVLAGSTVAGRTTVHCPMCQPRRSAAGSSGTRSIDRLSTPVDSTG